MMDTKKGFSGWAVKARHKNETTPTILAIKLAVVIRRNFGINTYLAEEILQIYIYVIIFQINQIDVHKYVRRNIKRMYVPGSVYICMRDYFCLAPIEISPHRRNLWALPT